jgi:hypothetical protein
VSPFSKVRESSRNISACSGSWPKPTHSRQLQRTIPRPEQEEYCDHDYKSDDASDGNHLAHPLPSHFFRCRVLSNGLIRTAILPAAVT